MARVDFIANIVAVMRFGHRRRAGVTNGRNAVIGAGSIVLQYVPDHVIAAGVPARNARMLTPPQLKGHWIWVPGIAPRSEWQVFYEELAAEFELRIDSAGPHFGDEVLLDTLAESSEVATLVGSRDRYIWPAGHKLRRIPISKPTLVYPISLIHRTSTHQRLAPIIEHFAALETVKPPSWRPSWAASTTIED